MCNYVVGSWSRFQQIHMIGHECPPVHILTPECVCVCVCRDQSLHPTGRFNCYFTSDVKRPASSLLSVSLSLSHRLFTLRLTFSRLEIRTLLLRKGAIRFQFCTSASTMAAENYILCALRCGHNVLCMSPSCMGTDAKKKPWMVIN